MGITYIPADNAPLDEETGFIYFYDCHEAIWFFVRYFKFWFDRGFNGIEAFDPLKICAILDPYTDDPQHHWLLLTDLLNIAEGFMQQLDANRDEK